MSTARELLVSPVDLGLPSSPAAAELRSLAALWAALGRGFAAPGDRLSLLALLLRELFEDVRLFEPGAVLVDQGVVFVRTDEGYGLVHPSTEIGLFHVGDAYGTPLPGAPHIGEARNAPALASPLRRRAPPPLARARTASLDDTLAAAQVLRPTQTGSDAWNALLQVRRRHVLDPWCVPGREYADLLEHGRLTGLTHAVVACLARRTAPRPEASP